MQVREFTGAGQDVLALGNVGFAQLPCRRDLTLDQALLEACKGATGLFDLLKQRPSRFAKLPRQRLDAAGAGRGIGHLVEVGFLQKHQLRVARDAPRESIGQSQRQRMRQHGDGVGAAKSGDECRHGRAQHIHISVPLGQHPPGGFSRDEDRLGRKAAGLFDARPQLPDATEFRHGQELVGIGAEPERDCRSRRIECDTAGFERAQITNGERKRKRQLLRLRAAGVVDRAAVGERERALEAAAHELADHLSKRLLHLRPCHSCAAAHGHGRQRLIVEADVDLCGIDPSGFDETGEVNTSVLAAEHGIERDRNPGIEQDTIEHPLEFLRRGIGDAEPTGARPAGEFKLEPARAVFELVQRLGVGLGGIRVIDPLHGLPRRRRGPAWYRARTFGVRIDRLDLKSVIGLADQFLERRALQHAVDQFAPVVIGRRRKIRSQPQVVGCGRHSRLLFQGSRCYSNALAVIPLAALGRKLPRAEGQAKRLFCDLVPVNQRPGAAQYRRSKRAPVLT